MFSSLITFFFRSAKTARFGALEIIYGQRLGLVIQLPGF